MSTRRVFRESVKYISQDVDAIPILNSFDIRNPRQAIYGKVDKQGRAIAPLNRSAISEIPGTNVTALNFVVDAYMDLQVNYQRLENRLFGLPSMQAKKGYVSPVQMYNRQLEEIFVTLYSSHILPHKNNIRDLDHFVEVVTSALLKYADDLPILYSSFVKSTLCPIHSTGLVIELRNDYHGIGTIELKRKMIQSPSFPAYAEMVAKHGFVLMKHAPWCLVADLSTTKMIDAAIQYTGINNSDIHENFFYNCRGYDLDKLRGEVEKYYRILYGAQSEDITYKVCSDGKIKEKRYRITRQTPEQARLSYSEKKWFKMYVKIRIAEEKLTIPETSF